MKVVQWLAVAFTLLIALAAIAYFVPRWDMFAVSKKETNDSPQVPVTPTETEKPKDQTPAEEKPEAAEKDFFDQNPFTPAKEGQLPKAVVQNKLHSFGRMALGDTGEHDFVIRNEGTAPLKIAKGPTQCKCTLAGLKQQEIPPGEEATVHLTWTPKEVGPFEQGAVIWTDDPHQPKVEFRVEGLMYPEIVVVPENGWSFGSIAKGGKVQLEGTVYSSMSADFQITSIETSTPDIEITMEPMTPRHLESSEAKAGYVLKGTLRGGTKAGEIHETVTLHTNSEKRPKIELFVNAVYSGPMLIVGPDWYAGNHLLRMGPVDAAKGATRKLTLMLEPGDVPFQLVEPKITPSFLKIEVKPEKVGKDQPRERYTLLITVPENARKGAYSGPSAAKIEAKTNHPSVDVFKMDVEFDVR